MPRKEFESFTRLDASDVNTYLMDQSVMTFAGTAARGSAITTPVEGMVTYLEDSNSLQLYDGSGWTAAGGVSSGNVIINGAFDFWQRGTSFTADGAYTADRWVMALSGATATTSRQTFTPGQTDVPGNPSYFLRFAVSTGDNAARIEQRIEDVTISSGQTYTLSFWAKGTNPAGGVVEVFSRQEFGTLGSAGNSVSQGTITLTGSWQRFTKTFTYDSVTGKTINAANFYGFDIRQPSADTGPAAWTLDLANVQLEAGPTANVFRRNANSLQGELAACQRYYYESATTVSYFCVGSVATSTDTTFAFPLPVRMRVAPSLSVSAAGDFLLTPGSIAISSFVVNGASPDIASFYTTSTGLTANQAKTLFGANANSRIKLTAEL
jgi:hypothetical protein